MLPLRANGLTGRFGSRRRRARWNPSAVCGRSDRLRYAAAFRENECSDRLIVDGRGLRVADRVCLLDDSELQTLTMRWKDIQAEFVDEPTTAVKEADALVAELMQRLAAMFASERHELENRWSSGSEVSTEDLRQGLRLYRSFFERLLAA